MLGGIAWAGLTGRERARSRGTSPKRKENAGVAVGAQNDTRSTMTYNDRTITYTGDLASYDYDSILRDKQRNINSLYELADYFTDADPIFRGSSTAYIRPLPSQAGSGWWAQTSR